MDASKSKNKENTKSDPSQDAINKKDKEKGEGDYVYASTGQGHMERTMFMVDLSRLKAEGDTLENALVLYRPEGDIKKTQYEQRCSQLVGLALCTMNFTGKYPEFLRLKGTSYAIRSLGDQYIIALSSRIDEPPSYCVRYLKTVTDLFRFYYSTPHDVMEANHQDWELYRRAMSQYMGSILEFIIRDQHSVPAMLNPLPYIQTGHCKKNAPRLYLLASRILRACQHHTSILGGCILHSSDLVMSQFPPEITEKLTVIGGGGISLDRRTVLADNIAPGKVWVVEVFLTRDEENLVTDYRKDHTSLQAAYSTLASSPHLTASTRLMSSASSSNASSGVQRSRGRWRKKTIQKSVSQSQSCDSGLSSCAGGEPPSSHPSQNSSTPSRAVTTPCKPLDSSTPVQNGSDQQKKDTMRSEDAVVFSPGLNTVTFDAGLAKEENRNSPSSTNEEDMVLRRTSSSSSSVKQDGDESEYVDAVETIDPTVAITTHTANLVNPLSTSATSQPQPIGRKDQECDTVFVDSRPCSISSEGFATPSPTPPRENPKFSTPVTSTTLYTTAEGGDPIQSALDKDAEGSKSEDQDTLTREHKADGGSKTINPNDLTDEELSALINAPVFVPAQTEVTRISGVNQSTKVMALPRSWKFKQAHDSDSDDDFVDSDALQQMLSESKMNSKSISFASRSSKWSPPPPLPPRNSQTSTRSQSHPPLSPRSSLGGSSSAPPPLPPRNYHTTASPVDRKVTTEIQPVDVTDSDVRDARILEVPSSRSKAWLYNTMERGKTGVGLEGGPAALKEYSDKRELSESDEFSDGEDDDDVLPTTPEDAVDKSELKNSEGDDQVVAASDVIISVDGDIVPGSIEVPPSKSDQSESTIAVTVIEETTLNNAEDKQSRTRTSTVDIYSDEPNLNAGVGDVAIGTTGSHYTQRTEEKLKQNGDIFVLKGDAVNVTKDDRGNETEPSFKTETTGSHASPSSTDNSMDKDHSAAIHIDQSTDKDSAAIFTDQSSLSDKEHSAAIHTGGDLTRDREDSAGNNSILYQLGDKVKDKFSRDSHIQVRSRYTSDSFRQSDVELSYGTDGTLTPVEMTYNPESILHALPLKLSQATPPNPPPRAPSKPKRPKRVEQRVDADDLSSEDETSTDGESSDADSSVAMAIERPRKDTKEWLAKTMQRQQSSASLGPHVTKMCLYVQQYMGTVIVLLADSGLHKNHAVLNSLWRSLLHQLMELEVGLRKDVTESATKSTPKPPNYLVTYSNYDRRCEAVPHTAPYHFRHALRRIHQEYAKDPSLLQISFSKEHLRILSQCVHEREVYLQPGRLGHLDALGMHGAIEKYAKAKNSLRQQPIGGPKVMFV